MNEPFQAYVLDETDAGVRGHLQRFSHAALDEGDTLVRVEYSSINYKDVLAGTGKGTIARRLPLIGGIDCSGEVVYSATFAPGQKVLVCGCGLSETHHGGYAQYAQMPGDWLVPVPNGLNTREVMALGTAGLSAALAVAKLEAAGITPDQGPIAVTGASGGVGSFAIDMLSLRGYEVAAISGSPAASDYLLSLGAARVINRHDILADDKPLGRATWAGVIDNVGGSLLANLLKAVLPNGTVASIGLAGGAKLVTTVLPFILRGVSLLGVNSVSLTPAVRANIWSRIASDLKPRHIDTIAGEEIDLAALPERLDSAFGAEHFGRSIVRIGATDK